MTGSSGGVFVEPLGGVAMVWMVGVGDSVEGLVESWNATAILLRWSIPFAADIVWIPDAGFALPDGGDGELVFPVSPKS
jgi:hypothetical protein